MELGDDISKWSRKEVINYIRYNLRKERSDDDEIGFDFVNNSRGGFDCFWFDVYRLQETDGCEAYKQIEIYPDKPNGSRRIRVCHRFSTNPKTKNYKADVERTEKYRYVIRQLQNRVLLKKPDFEEGHQKGRTTAYAVKEVRSKKDLDEFIKEEGIEKVHF